MVRNRRRADLAAILSLATAIACGPAAGEQPPPNVVIFLADDQGWGDLGVTGNTNVNTPNIDGLGEQALAARITAAHDPPLIGMEQDRDERIESYVKDFRPLVLGDMES